MSNIKTSLEVIQDSIFKKDLINLLNANSISGYIKPNNIPFLHKYCRLAPYVMDNLEQGKISLSPAMSFNDYFDSTINTIVSETAGMDKTNELYSMAGKINLDLDEVIDNKDAFAASIQERYEETQRHDFLSSSNYYGIKVCSLSKDPSSILMWSHYADNNQGICIGYDFDTLAPDHLLRCMLHPVAYCDHPVDLTKYFDFDNKICEYPADVALYTSALTKAACWSYEEEWRIVRITNQTTQNYLIYNSIIKPSHIILGYHWMKPLFDKERFLEHRSLLERLLNYAKDENITLYMTLPHIGEYRQSLFKTDIIEIENFIKRNFKEKYAENIRYYHIMHDELICMIRNQKEQV